MSPRAALICTIIYTVETHVQINMVLYLAYFGDEFGVLWGKHSPPWGALRFCLPFFVGGSGGGGAFTRVDVQNIKTVLGVNIWLYSFN